MSKELLKAYLQGAEFKNVDKLLGDIKTPTDARYLGETVAFRITNLAYREELFKNALMSISKIEIPESDSENLFFVVHTALSQVISIAKNVLEELPNDGNS